MCIHKPLVWYMAFSSGWFTFDLVKFIFNILHQ